MRKAVGIIKKRTRYVRAMNIVLATAESVHACSDFSEDPDYFQMQTNTVGNTLILCSEKFPSDGADWKPVANGAFLDLSLNGGSS